jgi:hypothetical protein
MQDGMEIGFDEWSMSIGSSVCETSANQNKGMVKNLKLGIMILPMISGK